MRLSILIPTLNRRALLERALDSARNQTCPAHEILVSDDGSRDGTQEYVATVSAIDPRVRLLPPNPTPGIFTNFNHLVSQSNGDAFCFLGDDDRLAPEFLELLSAPLSVDESVIASFCDHGIVNVDGTLQVEAAAQNSARWGRASLPGGVVRDPTDVALKQSLCIGFALFRSATFKDQPFDIECGGAADVDYTLRAASLGNFYYVPRVLADYGFHAGTATQTRAMYMVQGMIRALKKHHFVGEHEVARTAALKRVLLSHAVLTSPTDGRASFESLGEFLRLGGSPVNPRVIFATAIAVTPRSLAQRLAPLLRKGRRTLAQVRGAAP